MPFRRPDHSLISIFVLPQFCHNSTLKTQNRAKRVCNDVIVCRSSAAFLPFSKGRVAPKQAEKNKGADDGDRESSGLQPLRQALAALYGPPTTKEPIYRRRISCETRDLCRSTIRGRAPFTSCHGTIATRSQSPKTIWVSCFKDCRTERSDSVAQRVIPKRHFGAVDVKRL